MSETKLQSFVEKKVPGLFYIILVFAIIEFGILMACLLLSGNQDIIRVFNKNNTLIYEDIYDANALKEFKSLSGIRNFNKEGFVTTRTVVDNQFPTRTWIALSVCIPIIFILFVVFIVRVFEDVFRPKRKKQPIKEDSTGAAEFEETRFEKLFSTLGRLNIYALAATVIAAVFLYWMIPNLLIYMGKVSYQTIAELKWIILCVVILAGVYLIIREFLSYKTKTEMIRQQSEIQKNRDLLTIETRTTNVQLLEENHIDENAEDFPEPP